MIQALRTRIHGTGVTTASGSFGQYSWSPNKFSFNVEDSPQDDDERNAYLKRRSFATSRTIDALVKDRMTSAHRSSDSLGAHHPSLIKNKSCLHPKLLDSPVFIGCVYFVILISALQMGLQLDYPQFDRVWMITEHVCTACFTLELLVKLELLRWRYFHDSWNRFDFVLVVLAIVDNWVLGVLANSFGDKNVLSQLPVLRVIRVIRVARLARLLRIFKELGMIMKGIIDSLKTIFWVVFLLILVLYVCSIFCVYVIGREELYPGFAVEDEEIVNQYRIDGWNNYQYFGSISRSMYTLFNIILLTEVETIGRPVFEYQPFMLLFFVIFIVYTTFGVLNVIVGVIVDDTMAAAKAIEQEDFAKLKVHRLELLKSIRDLIFSLDTDENSLICINEVRDGWRQDHFLEMIMQLNLPKGWQAEDFMHLLDSNGNGSLEFDEFLVCFYRLLTSDEFQQSCCIHASLNQVKHMVYLLDHKVNAMANLQILNSEARMHGVSQSTGIAPGDTEKIEKAEKSLLKRLTTNDSISDYSQDPAIERETKVENALLRRKASSHSLSSYSQDPAIEKETKVENASLRRLSPTPSEFHDPKRPPNPTIFEHASYDATDMNAEEKLDPQKAFASSCLPETAPEWFRKFEERFDKFEERFEQSQLQLATCLEAVMTRVQPPVPLERLSCIHQL